jgi:hypothetical protein
MKKFCAIGCLMIACVSLLTAQPALVPLTHNTSLTDLHNQYYRTKLSSLSLPFFDDFNYTNVYPNPDLWSDNYAFVNATYPISPPTIGVATLEGLNPNGAPYSLNTNLVDYADKLTSQPIDMSALQSTDNVWFSFFYQARGNGDSPFKNRDRLYLEFKDNAQIWHSVWFAEVTVLDTFIQVFIPITDSKYFIDNFQFRFRNFGSLAGNVDHWHLDYIRLDKNRDTTIEKDIYDLAYNMPAPSIFMPYYTLPYNQIDTSYYRDNNTISVKNNFILPTTDFIDYFEAELLNDNSTLVDYSGISVDLAPNRAYIQSYPALQLPEGITDDTVSIALRYHFNTSAENASPQPVINNNSYEQIFQLSNYFAYDDATAERGFTVYNNSSDVDVAVKYHNIQADTLRALRLHLSNIVYDINNSKFDIKIWKGIGVGTTKDTLLYEEKDVSFSELRTLQDPRPGFNAFYYKEILPALNGTQPLIITGDYYVGITIKAGEKLVIGFDANDDAKNFCYYKLVTGWERSVFDGAFMINPVFGKSLPWQLTASEPQVMENFDVYPNPTSFWLHLPHNFSGFNYDIIDIQGAAVAHDYSMNNTINVANLVPGIYIIKIIQGEKLYVSRFIKQ